MHVHRSFGHSEKESLRTILIHNATHKEWWHASHDLAVVFSQIVSSLTWLTQICHSCWFLGLLMQTASLPDVCWLHLSLSVSLSQSCLTYPHVLKLQLVCPFPLAAIPYSLLFSRFYHFLTKYVIHVFFFSRYFLLPCNLSPMEIESSVYFVQWHISSTLRMFNICLCSFHWKEHKQMLSEWMEYVNGWTGWWLHGRWVLQRGPVFELLSTIHSLDAGWAMPLDAREKREPVSKPFLLSLNTGLATKWPWTLDC